MRILRKKQVSLKLHTKRYPRPFFLILWTSFTPQVMKMLILLAHSHSLFLIVKWFLACQTNTLNWPLQKIPYHTIMLFVTPKSCISIVFGFSWELKWPQEKLKTMLMQNFGMTNKEYDGMLWYFLEWSIVVFLF